jgi:AcrR family transcriptional regulator
VVNKHSFIFILRNRKNSSEKLLEAAIKLFVKKGYKASTVAEITKVAGLTHGGPYCHFNVKSDLGRGVSSLGYKTFVIEAVLNDAGLKFLVLKDLENVLRLEAVITQKGPCAGPMGS